MKLLITIFWIIIPFISETQSATILHLGSDDIADTAFWTTSNSDRLIDGLNANGSHAINWARINKTGSSLADIPTRLFSDLQTKPTTLSGYGITDPVVTTSGSFANPSWITSLAGSKLTGSLPDVVQQTNPAEYWNAYDIAGLADGAALSSWTGRNGSIANVTSAQAEFGGYGNAVYASGGLCGHPSMHCTGSSVLASTTNIASGSYTNLTVMYVTWPKSLPTNGGDEYTLGIGSGGNNRVCQIAALTGTEMVFRHVAASNNFAAKHRITASTLPYAQQPSVSFYTFDGSLNRSSLWINGVCTDSNIGGDSSITISGKVLIGNLSPGDGVIFDIGAVAFWPRTLNPSEIRKSSDFMYDQFIRDTRLRCFVTGDSIGEGTNQDANNTIVDQLQRALPQVRFVNSARGGHTMADQASGTEPYTDMFGSFRQGDVSLMFPGGIDIASNGTAVATVESNHTSVVALAKSQGASVVQATMIPKQAFPDNIDQATSDSHRAAYNAWLLTPSNSGSDAVIDLTSISGFTTDSAWHSTSNYNSIVNTITGTDSTSATHSILLANFASRTQRVASVIKVSDSSDVSSDFESTISSDGHILQTAGNLSGVSLTVTINDGAHVPSSATAAWVSPIVNALSPFIKNTNQLVSTATTGTPPIVVASTTNVANLNASSLSGATFAAPGAIGSTTASSGYFSTLGVGTQSPGSKLEINGGGNFVKTALLSGDNVNAAVYDVGGTTGKGEFGYVGSNGQFSLDAVAGDVIMKLSNTTGSFRIGVTDGSANTALHVGTTNVGIGNGSSSAGSLLDVGQAGSTLGTLRLEGNTSGYIQLQSSAAAGSWSLTFPTGAGTSGQALVTNGSGVTSWATVQSIATSADVTAQTVANTSVATVTSPNDGSAHTYTVSGYVNVTAIATDVLQLQVTYTDENNASGTATFFQQGSTSANIATTGNFLMPSMTIRVKSNTAITVKTILTVGTGSITYDSGGVIQKIN